MSDYHKLLAQTDSEARRNFNFDPRVAFQQEAKSGPPPKPKQEGSANQLDDPAGFAGIPEGSHTDFRVAQQAPTMREEKKQVVVDAALRDWTVYPNPYSNLTFAFGDGALEKPRIPVQTNNATYPSFALPPLNNPAFTPTPGAANTRGFSYLDPTGVQINLSAQNSSLPKGNFIAFDTSLNVQNNAGAFGCPLTPSNVVGIRLVRAVLPQTPFVSFPTDQVIQANLSGDKSAVSASPQYTFATNPYLLFFVNDYRGNQQAPTEAGRKSFAVLTQENRTQIDFSLTNGPQQFDYKPWNQEVLRFQSPLTTLQKLQISVTDALGNVFAVGQEDTMAVESIRLATATTITSNAVNVFISAITVSGNVATQSVQGNVWSNYTGCNVVVSGSTQEENNGSFIITDICTNISTGLTFSISSSIAVPESNSPAKASVKLPDTSNVAVSRATLACITPQYKNYLETQLRVGDSIVFHTPTLSNVIQSAALTNNQPKRDFTTALIGKSLPILAVKRYQLDPNTNQWLPTTSDPNLTDSTVDYFNVFQIPNFTTRDPNTGVLTDIQADAVDDNPTHEILNMAAILGSTRDLPFLNTTQQPIQTFELDVVTPDTTNLGGKPVF